MDCYYASDSSFLDGGVPFSQMDKFQITIDMFNELRLNIFCQIQNLEKNDFCGNNAVEINRKWRMIRQIDQQIKIIEFKFHTTPIHDLTRIVAIEYPDGRIVEVQYEEIVQ